MGQMNNHGRQLTHQISQVQGNPTGGSVTADFSVRSAYRNFKFEINLLVFLAPGLNMHTYGCKCVEIAEISL